MVVGLIMREYIFHGKSKETGEWVEGYLTYCPTRKQYYIMNNIHSFPIPVYKKSIGQWSGVCDTNGRKIFEGDIISIMFETDGVDGFPGYSWYESAVVVFSEDKHAWIVVFDDGGEEMYLNEYNDMDDVYVIATVFDNVDLLEG